MIRLSVNINKLALIRNSRGGNNPDIVQSAIDCERFGANGITVHPRPDERHIRYSDAFELKKVLKTELNIEGNPMEKKFVDLVMAVKPAQVTLVPDSQDQLTSNHGWDTVLHKQFLAELVSLFASAHIRVSIFVDPNIKMVQAAQETGAERIELYTEMYASAYSTHRELAIKEYIEAAKEAYVLGLAVNAGHDLNLENLHYFVKNVPHIKEVSIGHALICDSIFYGLENAIQLYRRKLR